MATQSNQQEFKEKAKEAILALDKVEVVRLAERAVSELNVSDLIGLIEEGFNTGLSIIGDRFGRREMFLPELIAAAEAMKEALKIIELKLRESKVNRGSLGKIVLATVKGDIHDIGKTIVGSMLTARGFDVIDLGTDVPADEIISSAEGEGAHIIGVLPF